LRHILEAIASVEEYTKDLDWDGFLKSRQQLTLGQSQLFSI
jgi:uncharacterized protein with HEPN domain